MLQMLSLADTGLFRANPATLSDQTRMELLIAESPDALHQKFSDKEGDYLDVCDWESVACDDDGNVTKIDLCMFELGGSVSLEYLPPMLEYLDMSRFEWRYSKFYLSGTLDAALLPRYMTVCNLKNNLFSGCVDFTQFPPTMREILLASNEFSGGVVLNKLPATLRTLFLDKNKFSGNLDLTALPADIIFCSMNINRFTGTIDLTALPQKLAHLGLKANHLEGSVDLSSIPKSMVALNLRQNFFDPIEKDRRRKWLFHGQPMQNRV